MLAALTTGLVLGTSAGLAPGPLLSLVITQTLRYGAMEGVKVALAPLISDLPIIVLCLLVMGRVAQIEMVLGILSVCGGIYVLVLAYENWRTGPVSFDAEQHKPKSLRKGVLVNFLNPHPYFFWLTVGAPLMFKLHRDDPWYPVLFLTMFYVMLVGAKIGLALITGRSRDFLRKKAYLMVMRFMALVLAAFALLLLRDAARYFGL